jgi:FkbM family methyltransferase
VVTAVASRAHLILRMVIDCAYLVRSGLSRRNQCRVLIEYLRLTLKAVFCRTLDRSGTERVLDYSVRHFGLGALQFLFREIFVRNEYLFQASGDRPVVFDCGANVGVATLFFKWIYPHSEVHAFEPDPVTFAALKENVLRNKLTNVCLYNVALAATPGRLDLFVPAGSAGSPLMSTLPGRIEGNVRRVAVEADALSRHIADRRIDFLKLDVEGVEETVLREVARAGKLGMIKELAIEYHHNIERSVGSIGSCLQLLQDHGYQYQLDATWGNPQSAGAFQDVLIRAYRAAVPIGRQRNDSTPVKAAV